MAKYNWLTVIDLAKELVPQCTSLAELCTAINARVQIPRATLRDGLKRELGLEGSSIEAIKAALLPEDRQMSSLAQSLLEVLRDEGRDVALSMLDLVERFDRAPSSIETAAEELRENDYYIEISDDKHMMMPSFIPPTGGRLPVEMWTRPQRIHRYGIVSDTHLGNRKARLEILELLYDIFEEEGIETVLLSGNMIDGECKWNRHELVAHGVEGQIAYAAKHYPQRDGIVTQFLTADDHEGWWAKDIGLDIGRRMQNGFRERGREDLVWIGHVERDLELDPENPRSVLRVLHPGGGTAYAISYKPQKIAEGWQGGEKPSVAISGHYHKYGAFYPREVYFLLAGAVCDQTMFMRKKPLAAHVGGIILEVHLSSQGGVTRVKHEWFPFYDRGFYDEWDYFSMWEPSKAKYVGDGQFETVD